MRKLVYNYIKPQNYYNRLVTFFAFVSISLAFSLVGFRVDDLDIFLLKFLIIFFFLISFAALLEFYYSGDYMGPLEVYDVEYFYKNLILEFRTSKEFDFHKYFHKYNLKCKESFCKVYDNRKVYTLSSIRKLNGTYTITVINANRMPIFSIPLIRFIVARGAIHKLYLKKFDNEFKIIKVE